MTIKKIFLFIAISLFPMTNLFAQIQSVSTTANPIAGGTITGGGNYLNGTTAELTANPNTGYTFTNWTGDISSTDNPVNVLVDSDKNITGNFTLNSYTISTSSDPVSGGNAIGGGTVDHGDLVNLVATSATGYKFVNWTESDVQVSADSNYSFSADSDRNLVANFILKTYTISTNSDPVAGGNTSGGGTVNHGDLVNLVATSATGYKFVNWTESDVQVSADSNYSFTADASRNLVANFILKTYSIVTSSIPVEGGTTSGGGVVTHGDVVNLVATSNEGFMFVNWTESDVQVSTDSNYSFTADASRTLVANFSLNNYLISTSSNPVAGGVTSGGGAFDHGDNVELVATPVDGYTFTNWTENEAIVSTDSLYSFVATASRNLVANFTINSYEVTLSALPVEGGVNTGAGTYEHGSMVNVIATPNTGWNFDNWKVDNSVVSNDSSYSFVILNSINLNSNFSKKIFSINTTSNPTEGGSSVGTGNYAYDSTVTIVATPNTGWNFINWTEVDEEVFSDSLNEFKAVEDRDLVANFELKTYSITTSSTPDEGGITSGDSVYTHGDEVTVTAIANSDSGYDFVNWTENGSQVSTNSVYKFTATTERSLVANFELRTYSITLLTNPNGAGTVSGSGNYTHGDIVSISTTPGAGWLFANWTESDVIISDLKTFEFKITGNRTITANFANQLYSISASPDPLDAGNISGAGTAFYNQMIKLIANPNPGWDFKDWREDGNIVSTDQNYEFTVTGDRSLIATFSLTNFSITCSASPVEAGITSGCGISFYNQEMTVKAIANNGWEFIKWTENGEDVSTSMNYSFTVESDRDLVAIFDFIDGIEKLDDFEQIPDTYYLSNAYPNPFNPSTKIKFGIPESSTVKAFISDVNGSIVKTLFSDTSLPSGNYLGTFEAEDMASGMYFFIIYAKSDISDKNFKEVKKLLLLK